MALRIEWLQGAAAFAELATRWDALAATHESAAFHSHGWCMAWWRAFGTDRDEDLEVCTVWDAGELVAGLALGRGPRALTGTASVDSPYLRPLHRNGPALAALLDATLARAPAELVLPLVPCDGPVGAAIARAGRRAHRLTYADVPQREPIVDLEGTWEDYSARMKPHWRTLVRHGRKMAREHALERRMVEPPHDLAAQLTRGLALEGSGWKGEAGTAIVRRPAHERFYREVADHLAARDQLRFSEILLDGELVAFDYTVLSGGRLYLLKTTYSEAHGRLSPGMVLRHGVVERCYELGLEAHELLGTDTAWKGRFSTSHRDVANWHALRPTPRSAGQVGYRRVVRPQLREGYLRWIKPRREARRKAARAAG